jgi:thiol-disulfide isomerase/thioredoxin
MKLSETKFLFLSFLSIVLFSKIENFALDIGTSWTFAKLLPYGITIACGVLLFFQIKKISFNRYLLKYTFSILALILPFTIGFAFHPIYEGDFSSEGEIIKKNTYLSEFKNDGLTVTTIPECPFCFGSIEKLKKIQKRNPKLKIDFIVCAKNIKYLKKYKNEINGAFSIRMAENADSLAITSGLRFPTFFLIKNKKPVYKWSNDQFGVCAIDEFESNF